jgi:hypothetical protein
MRRSDARRGLLAMLAVTSAAPVGCVWRMDGEFLANGDTYETDADVDGATAPDAAATAPPVATGCTLFPELSGVASLAGDTRSLPLTDGGALWIVDQAVAADGRSVLPATIAVGAGASSSCAGWSASLAGPATTPSPLEDGGAITPLDLAATAAGPALYYEAFAPDPSAPLGLRALGIGIASRGSSGAFVLTSDLLWTPDRPAFGGSALRMGSTVFVWGCKSMDAFDADCYVAQVDADRVAVASAYTYWAGDAWSTDVDDATPVTSAGGVVSVRPDPTRPGRLLMTYVPPLGDTLVVRSALAPQGPWSGPVVLASCDLTGAGPGAFCAGGEQHPELAVGGGLVLSYDARTFTADAGAPAAFAPRLVTFPVPATLP